MYSIYIYALAFVIIPIGTFFVLGWSVFYHLENYGLSGDSSKKTALFFSIVLALISLSIIITFFFIDWERASLEEFMSKSGINSYSSDYEQ